MKGRCGRTRLSPAGTSPADADAPLLPPGQRLTGRVMKPATPRPLHSEPPGGKRSRGRAGQPARHSAGPRAAVPSARDKQKRQANSEGASVPGANHRSLRQVTTPPWGC